MQQLFSIAWKDLLLNFRDRSGLLIMLVAPFALILIIGAAFGGFSEDSGPGIADIPVILVNLDSGEFGDYILEAFQSDDLADLVEPVIFSDPIEAKKAVDEDQVAAAVIIPEDFSEAIFPQALRDSLSNNQAPVEFTPATAEVEVYRNPSRSISSGVIRSIVDTILDGFINGQLSAEIQIGQMLRSGEISIQDLLDNGEMIGREVVEQPLDNGLVTIDEQTHQTKTQTEEFDWLTYSVHSMAVLYLMFTIQAAGRSILTERSEGTLPRMLITPTQPTNIIGGKMLGAFFTGVIQMAIVLFGGTLLYNVHWGSIPALIILTLCVVAAATGWAMVIAAFSRSSGQANAIGTAFTLTFAAASGNFLPRGALPQWLQTMSLISPNAWSLEGFTKLSAGNGFSAIIPSVIGLLVMAGLLFLIASLIFRRQYQ